MPDRFMKPLSALLAVSFDPDVAMTAASARDMKVGTAFPANPIGGGVLGITLGAIDGCLEFFR